MQLTTLYLLDLSRFCCTATVFCQHSSCLLDDPSCIIMLLPAVCLRSGSINCRRCQPGDVAGPGSFLSGPEPTFINEMAHLTQEHRLSDSSSLIGQLCPALRLCLAAEVATGLLCDRWVVGRQSTEVFLVLGLGLCWV